MKHIYNNDLVIIYVEVLSSLYIYKCKIWHHICIVGKNHTDFIFIYTYSRWIWNDSI